MDKATQWNSGKMARTTFVTGFYFLIFKIFSFQDNFKSKLRMLCYYYVHVSKNRGKFSHFPEHHWAASLMIYAFYPTTFFQLSVYPVTKDAMYWPNPNQACANLVKYLHQATP